MINLYTDYPFSELGDLPGSLAPIRQIIFISYDGNKYCEVAVAGIIASVKLGYIYTAFGRSGEVSVFDINFLAAGAIE